MKKSRSVRFDIVTIFPEVLSAYAEESLFKRARIRKIVEVVFHDLRRFSANRHRKVDDKPFGGGPGMVIQVEPVYKAVSSIARRASRKKGKTRIILFSTRGKVFDASAARRLARYDRIVLICGRYEGIDARVDKILKTEQISIGDYVLTGGELPAMVLVDCMSRQIPGVLGNFDSREEERISSSEVYTRPEILIYKTKKHRVPQVLLSGDHKKIEEWKAQNNN